MFRPVQSKKLHKQVFEQIQGLILSGRIKPGERLPSERDLSEMLQVSRNSIREALRSLEVLGIVECRHGGGNYIKLDIGSGILEPLSIMFQLHGGGLADILDVRRTLESEAAALAARRIAPERAKELLSIVERLKGEKGELECVRLDKEFHLKIAEASGNALILSFLNAISSILERSIKDGRRAIMRSLRDHGVLVASHEALCKAIAKGDPDAARRAVDRHFKMIVDNLPKA